MNRPSRYELVRLAGGAASVRSLVHGETFHPVVGPVAEARALYTCQIEALRSVPRGQSAVVVWDVGLGGGANAAAMIQATAEAGLPLELISFDATLEPLNFALQHAEALGYFGDCTAAARELAGKPSVPLRCRHAGRSLTWQIVLGDFPSWLFSPEAARAAKPDAILFDAYSPARNPEMWTLPLFTRLHGLLDADRLCTLATYSRSTMLRVALLLAGFFVGAGGATGEKEETTVASTRIEELAVPLGKEWLKRVFRSTSAEPLDGPVYRQAPISTANWEKLITHPQFREG